MRSVAALFLGAVMVGELETTACTFEPRDIRIADEDGASGAGGQGGAGMTHDASGGGSGGAGGRFDASFDGNSGADGSGGTSGPGGAAGNAGAAGGAAAGGSGGAAGRDGAAGSGTSGGTGGAGGNTSVGGASGAAGAVGTGATGGTGGSGGAAGTGAGGATGGAGGFDGGTTAGAAGRSGAGNGGSDAGTSFDARDGAGGAGGSTTVIVTFFEEKFDAALGVFKAEDNCGPTPPVWSNSGGYAHAPALAKAGVSTIYSPIIDVPLNASDVRLRLRHKIDTVAGYDGGQLVVVIDGTTRLVKEADFVLGPYVDGAGHNPDTCFIHDDGLPGWIGDAWSGRPDEFESEVNLSAAPFNILPGSTISIRLRMLVDAKEAGAGWDVNWVKLTAISN
jgi:hypothetical protein